MLALTLLSELKLDRITLGILALLDPTTFHEVPYDIVEAGRVNKCQVL